MRVAVEGPRFKIIYAIDARGTCPAEEFLNELQNKNDPGRKSDHANIFHLFRMMAEQGRISNREKFKQLEGVNPSLVEFKKHQVRVFGFYDGEGVIVLTHGVIKKKDKMDPADIDRAHRIRSEHLEAREEDQ